MALAFASGGSAGGGGFTPSRNVGQIELDWAGVVTQADALLPVSLAYSGGDATMVDLSTPTAPTIVTAGTYAYTLLVVVVAPANSCLAQLVVDDAFYSISTDVIVYGPPSTYANGSESVTWWCEDGDPFAVRIATQTDPATESMNGQLFIQRLA